MVTQKKYSLILGIALIVIGITGFFKDKVIGIVDVNTTYAIILVVTGLIGLYIGIFGEGPGYAGTVGWTSIGLYLLGVLPGIHLIVNKLIGSNDLFHFLIGIISLGFFYTKE